jgi:Xaa-Pro dipeptidase
VRQYSAAAALFIIIAENYDEVLKGKYPAKEHARKVAKWIIDKGGDKKGTIYLEAQKQKLQEVCICDGL